MFAWSTDKVHARERFAYWQEMVCQSVLNVSTASAPENFSARISGRSFGDLRFVQFACTGHELERSRDQVARRPEDYYVITLHLAGRSHFSQGEETVSLEPNEIAIVDGRHPFRIAFKEEVRRATAVIPHAMLDSRAPWLRSGARRKIKSDAPFAELARHHLLNLTASESDLSESATNLLTDNLCNLVALATSPGLAPDRLQPELQIQAFLAFCRQNLHEPGLSPAHVADHFGVSIRTVHSRFKAAGQTFGRFMRDNRLDACRAALRDDSQRLLNISEIAYRWGFNDLSHFNRAFRSRFQQTPREWRDRGNG